MKTSSAFNMKKDIKRMLALMQHQDVHSFKRSMILAQVASELRPKVKEKRTQENNDD